ncbi:MAG: helix-turn-helix domain-containing protein [Acidimicrobiales bacterium]
MDVKLVYTVREAAELLCIGYSTARERIASGELRSFKDGSRRLITGEDLVAYVKARQRETAA